jgi:hypothetical protein
VRRSPSVTAQHAIYQAADKGNAKTWALIAVVAIATVIDRSTAPIGHLDRLIAENSEQVLDQRHVLSRLSDHSQKAELVRKFLEDLLSTQKLYIEDREKLLVEMRG